MKKTKTGRLQRHKRVRAKIIGTASRPRLSVYRSNKHLFLQLIDDKNKRTLVSASDKGLKIKTKNKSVMAHETGKLLAKRAQDAGIKSAVFDRGGYQYHGRVQKVAEGAREGGLSF